MSDMRIDLDALAEAEKKVVLLAKIEGARLALGAAREMVNKFGVKRFGRKADVHTICGQLESGLSGMDPSALVVESQKGKG